MTTADGSDGDPAPPVGPAVVERQVLGVADDAPPGSLVLTRQVVRIRDHGVGAAALAVVGLAADDAAAVVDEELAGDRFAGGVTDLEPLAVDVRAGDEPGHVEVVLSVGATHRWPAAEAPDRLLGVLTRRRLDEEPDRPRLHGGAVVGARGHAALVLGRSGAGKSTLVAHLAHGGLGLVNDEQVTLYPEHGLVAGFTRPVAIKPGGARFLPPDVGARVQAHDVTELVPASTLGTRHRLTGAPVLVVLPERDADAAEVTWEVLSAGHALEALCANNLDLERLPIAGLEAFAWLATTTTTVRLRYREAAAAAEVVRALLADPPVAAGAGAGAGAAWTVTETEPATDPGSGRSRPAPDVLAVDLGAELLLFHRRTLHLALLNGDGAELWRALPIDPQAQAPGVAAFLGDLSDHGFVTAPPAPPAVLPTTGPFRRVARAVHRRQRDQVLVVDGGGGFHELEGAAAVVWCQLDRSATLPELVGRVVGDQPAGIGPGDHGLDPVVVARETERGLVALVDAGLVVAAAGAP